MGLRISRRGFTLIEMLYATTVLVVAVWILGKNFSTGIDTFRALKAGADLSEGLRRDCTQLHRDIQATTKLATRFVLDGLIRGRQNRKTARELRIRYEKIREDACKIEPQLQEVEAGTDDPVALRVIQETIENLTRIKESSGELIVVLKILE